MNRAFSAESPIEAEGPDGRARRHRRRAWRRFGQGAPRGAGASEGGAGERPRADPRAARAGRPRRRSAPSGFRALADDDRRPALFDFASRHVFPASNPSAAERLSLVAVGGYGRGTLAPASDIDLLFLFPYKQTPWSESVTEYILYMLWDLRLKVGHATRTVNETLKAAREDMTVRTALLEARHLCGDAALFDELQTRFEKEVVAGTAREFIAAKLAERDCAASPASAQSRYLVEPNVKEGKGGQRDLQTLFWIAKYYYRVGANEALVDAGLLSRQEYSAVPPLLRFPLGGALPSALPRRPGGGAPLLRLCSRSSRAGSATRSIRGCKRPSAS